MIIIEQIRNQRDMLLASTDFTVLPDSPYSSVLQNEWVAYRQALRDFPRDYLENPALSFPVPPEDLPGGLLSLQNIPQG